MDFLTKWKLGRFPLQKFYNINSWYCLKCWFVFPHLTPTGSRNVYSIDPRARLKIWFPRYTFYYRNIELLALCKHLPMSSLSSCCCCKSNRSKGWSVVTSLVNVIKLYWELGGSPGLLVIGGDSCSKGCGFESQPCIPDGHFSHLFVVKIVMFVSKR